MNLCLTRKATLKTHTSPPNLGVEDSTSQDALKGTNLRGQTEPKRRFSLILADSRLFLESKAFGQRRFPQKTTDFRRFSQKTAGTRRKPQISVCSLRFVPLSAALTYQIWEGESSKITRFPVLLGATRLGGGTPSPPKIWGGMDFQGSGKERKKGQGGRKKSSDGSGGDGCPALLPSSSS